ncbi:hypothetical protein Slin15195_G021550 [Septoria linicola]|uniref:BTB domain-containing protein n=1 Tax=Septoria linicola TaxID=215465 RepID=A0A9Q9AQ93_9PEZI|nr:hypothetical protein Slin14017_G129520 [Septoria linicola]USW48836.1 hypothetical protein Slin15195_G021550 [Septoria linicola]
MAPSQAVGSPIGGGTDWSSSSTYPMLLPPMSSSRVRSLPDSLIEMTETLERSNVARLPGENPEIFQRMLQYLECRSITWYYEHPLDLSFDTIIDIYGLGIRRDIPLIQNVATGLFATKIKEQQHFLDRWSIEYLWERCPPGFPSTQSSTFVAWT